MTRRIDLVAPAGIDDDRHPSGGDRYDREVAAALAADGWSVRTIEPGSPPRSDAVTLLDGRLLDHVDDLTPQLADHVVPLLHTPPPDRSAVLDLLSSAPTVITTSAATREQTLELLAGRSAPPIVVAQPGLGRTRPADAFPGGKRIRCVAALVPEKGQDVLLEALARIRDLEWRCELVGATDLDQGFVRGLREQAVRLGIADRVLLAGAWRPDPVSRIYEGCDVLVVPSRVESYGMVIAEAIGCGIPVITSDTGGTREALGGLRSARPGLLVRPGDPAELARALQAWLSSRGLRLDLAAAARARSSHRRTWTMTARIVAGVLDGAATRTGSEDRVAG